MFIFDSRRLHQQVLCQRRVARWRLLRQPPLQPLRSSSGLPHGQRRHSPLQQHQLKTSGKRESLTSLTITSSKSIKLITSSIGPYGVS
jgi:hypothetical protein